MIRRSIKAFSLIELIVVIAVMAAIAAVIIPSISGTREAAEQQTAISAAGTLNMAQVQWRLVTTNVTSWKTMSNSDRYTAIAKYMEYADADWDTFQKHYPNYTLSFLTLDGSNRMQKVTITRNSDSKNVPY
jgi:prepilin-type N-terminal cleavage/methylation domain-containing protein